MEGVTPDISDLLHQYFGFQNFRPGQREVIEERIAKTAWHEALKNNLNRKIYPCQKGTQFSAIMKDAAWVVGCLELLHLFFSYLAFSSHWFSQ